MCNNSGLVRDKPLGAPAYVKLVYYDRIYTEGTFLLEAWVLHKNEDKWSKTVSIWYIYNTWKDLVILAKTTFNPIRPNIKANPTSEDTPRYCHNITIATAA